MKVFFFFKKKRNNKQRKFCENFKQLFTISFKCVQSFMALGRIISQRSEILARKP